MYATGEEAVFVVVVAAGLIHPLRPVALLLIIVEDVFTALQGYLQLEITRVERPIFFAVRMIEPCLTLAHGSVFLVQSHAPGMGLQGLVVALSFIELTGVLARAGVHDDGRQYEHRNVPDEP